MDVKKVVIICDVLCCRGTAIKAMNRKLGPRKI